MLQYFLCRHEKRFLQKCFILLFSNCFDEYRYNLTLVNRYRIVNRLVEDSQDELLALDVKNLLSNCLFEVVLLLLQTFVLSQMDLIMVFRVYVKTEIFSLSKTNHMSL